MLYLHDWPDGFEEVVLLCHSGSPGFRLTSLAAIPLHSAAGYKGLAAKLHFRVAFILLYRLLVHFFNPIFLKW